MEGVEGAAHIVRPSADANGTSRPALVVLDFLQLVAGENSKREDLRERIGRAAYMGRIRDLARKVARSYLDSRARLGFPMAPKAWSEEVLADMAKAEQKKKAA